MGSTTIQVPSGFSACADMRGRAGRVAHVVQAVEAGHEVEVRARELLGLGDLEARAAGDAMLLRMRPRLLDRAGVEVEADELRVRERLRHQHGRPAMAAADIGDLGAALRAWPPRRPAPAASSRTRLFW